MTEFNKILISKYLSNECSAEEVSFIDNYLKHHPDALEEILSEQEWLSYIQKKKNYPFSFFKIAAMLVLCMGAALMIYVYQSRQQPAMVQPKAVIHYIKQQNKSAKNLILHIEDGSEITLAPGSAISYLRPLARDKRDFVLQGEGVFEVAKDKSRPFRVTAGGLTTTALGTKFKVTAHLHSEKTEVKLLEGKIKVSPAGKGAASQKEYFLNAGDEILFDRKSYAIHQSVYKDPQLRYAERAIEKKEVEAAAVPRSEISGEHVRFSNEHLEKVLDLLNTQLNANIHYQKKEIRKMYFSGEFKRLTNAEGINNNQAIIKEILSTVATLNQLDLEATEDGYVLSKPIN